MKHLLRTCACTLSALACLACRETTAPSSASAPPILFEMTSLFNAIFAVNPDGTRLSQLTDATHFDGSSAWSPDGSHIAFSSGRDGQIELYTMQSDATNPVRLTHTDVIPGSAAPRLFMGSWSSKNVLAYVFTPPFETQGNLMTIPASGGTSTALTTGNQTLVGADWSPDGNRIVFTSTQVGGTSHLFIINVDGSGLTQITSGSVGDGGPSWSPNGQRIAFFRGASASDIHIWVMNADGTSPLQLTTGSWSDTWPSWSPDGTQIAFASTRDGAGDIYVTNADGSNVRRITTSAIRKTWVRWRRSP